ncbi:MAG: hypothetical protein IJA07_02290 [Agathobacter sp.]|nr:hypothetical protein [Agathobacter sp.]
MKRQVSVSIFLAILVIALAWLYIKFSNETKPKERTISTENEVSEKEALTISQEYITCPYYIKESDGRLIVFESKTQDVFMETSIETMTLPEEIQEKLETGIFFQTEGELYDFLESYSS